ncbi:MAG: hypothetical protein KAS77_06975, partial [Thermoplasmata archaeon]|nr:hypothetical protein [Thermoplasmata archaeon]
QAIKAGILEIGDVFIVNKADRPGVERIVGELEAMMSLDKDWRHADEEDEGYWKRPILVTVARDGDGIGEVVSSFESHREFLDRTGTRKAVEEQRFESIIREMLGDLVIDLMERAVSREELEVIVADVAARRIDKMEAVERLMDRIMDQRGTG